VNSNRKFNNTIILLVVTLVLVGTVGYYLSLNKKSTDVFQFAVTTTPSTETANWKTYNNTKHAYSFRYPDDMYTPLVGGEGGSKPADAETTTFLLYSSNPDNRYIVVSVVDQKTNLSDSNDIEEVESTEVSVQNAKVYKYKDTPGYQFRYSYQYVFDNGKDQVYFSLFHNDDPLVLEKLRQILSTFKFTN